MQQLSKRILQLGAGWRQYQAAPAFNVVPSAASPRPAQRMPVRIGAETSNNSNI